MRFWSWYGAFLWDYAIDTVSLYGRLYRFIYIILLLRIAFIVSGFEWSPGVENLFPVFGGYPLEDSWQELLNLFCVGGWGSGHHYTLSDIS